MESVGQSRRTFCRLLGKPRVPFSWMTPTYTLPAGGDATLAPCQHFWAPACDPHKYQPEKSNPKPHDHRRNGARVRPAALPTAGRPHPCALDPCVSVVVLRLASCLVSSSHVKDTVLYWYFIFHRLFASSCAWWCLTYIYSIVFLIIKSIHFSSV